MATDHHVGLALTFVAALLVAQACAPPWIEPTYRCKPSASPTDERCPADQLCCSDDPAALDLGDVDSMALPNFGLQGKPTQSGTPLFAGDRNDAAEWGHCVDVGSVPPALALANGCPIPCNPTWGSAEIDAVCGVDMYCCQSAEIEATDCVLDPNLGDDGCWRPVRGDDIQGLGGLALTDWGPSTHATHQDPGGQACEAFAAGLGESEQVYRACLARLGVANQRGYCLDGPGVSGCPLAQPGYRDPCEQRNDAEARGGCS